MRKQIELAEAQEHLSRLIEQAATGTEVVIARNGEPLAMLVALKSGPLKKRKLGGSKHRFEETIPREIADAEIAQDFDASELWPES